MELGHRELGHDGAGAQGTGARWSWGTVKLGHSDPGAQWSWDTVDHEQQWFWGTVELSHSWGTVKPGHSEAGMAQQLISGYHELNKIHDHIIKICYRDSSFFSKWLVFNNNTKYQRNTFLEFESKCKNSVILCGLFLWLIYFESAVKVTMHISILWCIYLNHVSPSASHGILKWERIFIKLMMSYNGQNNFIKQLIRDTYIIDLYAPNYWSSLSYSCIHFHFIISSRHIQHLYPFNELKFQPNLS